MPGITLHVETLYGPTTPYLGVVFKGAGRALRAAVAIDPRAAAKSRRLKERWVHSESEAFASD